MIYTIVILGIITVLFFVFKGKIKDFITKKVKAKQDVIDDDFVFSPIGMTRDFQINFTIQEMGNGKAKIIINK